MIPHPIPAGSPRQGVFWSLDFDRQSLDEVSVRSSDAMFLALQPPAQIAAQAYRLAQNICDVNGLRCPLTDPERLHLSLLGFGRRALSQAAIDVLCRVAVTVAMPAFRVELNRAMSFGKKSDNKHKRPFVLVGDDLTTSGIVMLRQYIIRALHDAGCTAHIPSRFTPHMTLFWDRHDPGEQPIEELGWTARDFVLIRSCRGLSKHEVLGRWPLQTTA
jgi:RNA 2',3'-cyclic 3'-phosphodiesterase